jgi:hypothetical protein
LPWYVVLSGERSRICAGQRRTRGARGIDAGAPPRRHVA